MVTVALSGLQRICRDRYRCVKAGVIFVDIQPGNGRQHDLFDGPTPVITLQVDARTKLMGFMDCVNRGTGRGKSRLASAGITST